MEQVKINSISIDDAEKFAVHIVEKKFRCNVKAIKYLGGGYCQQTGSLHSV